jgi:hypothetical protein
MLSPLPAGFTVKKFSPMKLPQLLLQGLQCSSLIALALALQGGCVPVQDTKNRENQIKNASKTFVEAYMAKRVLQSKEAVRDTYDQIYSLQDSIQQALREVQTVEELKAASLQAELQEVENMENEPLAYINYASNDDHTRQFGQLLLSQDVQKSSDKLFRMIHLMRSGNKLPDTYAELKATAKARSSFLFNVQEYLNKRALSASQGYRRWEAVYRLKGMELHEAVLQDKRFTMTDLERIDTEYLAEQYLALSLEFVEKSDSLLAASKDAHNPWKAGAEVKIKTNLRLQNLANKL